MKISIFVKTVLEKDLSLNLNLNLNYYATEMEIKMQSL